jgi:hypothetical protein
VLRFSLYFLFFIFISCTKDKGKINYGNYPTEIGEIISTNCSTSGCHTSKSYLAASGLNLESWESLYLGSNSGAAIIPFNSRFSSLCYFVNTFPELGSINKPTMPLNKSVLSYENVAKLKTWIDAGAYDVNGNLKWTRFNTLKKLYAINQGCDVVTVFESQTQLPINYIKVGNKSTGNTPHQIRVSPDGNYFYVIFIATNYMQKYRCSDDSYIGDINLGAAQDWNTFIISSNSKRAYCASFTTNGKISVVDLEKLKLINSYALP